MDFKRRAGQKKQPANNSPQVGPPLPSGNKPASAELSFYFHVLRVAQGIHDFHKEWETLENIGDVFMREGDHQQASTYYQHALSVAKARNDRHRELGSLFSVSKALDMAGKKEQARHYHDQGMAIARQGKGNMLSELGIHLASAGGEEYLKRGIAMFELHLQIAREQGNRAGEQMALGNLGSAYLNLGFIHRAIDYIKKALAIAEELNNTDGKQAALGSLATAYKNAGDLGKAGKYIDEAVTLSRETGNQYRLAINVFNKARLLVEQGDLKRALPLAQEAAELFERNDDPNAERAKALVTQILFSAR